MKVAVKKTEQHGVGRLSSIGYSFFVAFSLYSIIPVPRTRWDDDSRRYAFCFFPLIGLMITACIIIWLWVCRAIEQPMLFAAGATALPVLLTGGIHMDGFCDVSDALGAQATPEKSLEIMKDSRSGAFAVISCVLWGIVSFAVWYAYFEEPVFQALFIFVLSRSLSGLSVLCTPRARKGGLAAGFADSADQRPVIVVLGLYAVLSGCAMLYHSLTSGILCILTIGFFSYGYRRMMLKRFGGVTGDCAGWFLVLAELLGVLAFVIGRGLVL